VFEAAENMALIKAGTDYLLALSGATTALEVKNILTNDFIPSLGLPEADQVDS
jgi:hypothetical protein